MLSFPTSPPSPGLILSLSCPPFTLRTQAAILFQPAVHMTEHGRDDGKALCSCICIFLFFIYFFSLSPEKILQKAGERERKKKPAAESGGIRTEEGVLAFFFFFFPEDVRVNLKHLFWRRFYSTFFQGAFRNEASINSTLLSSGNPSPLCGVEKIQ